MIYSEHFMIAPLSNSDHGHLHGALGDDSQARWTPVGLFLFTRSGEPCLGFTLRGRGRMHFSKALHCARKGSRQRLCQGQFPRSNGNLFPAVPATCSSKEHFPFAGKHHFCIFQAVALSCGQASLEESWIPSRNLQHWHTTQ